MIPYVLDSSASHNKHYYFNQAKGGISVFRENYQDVSGFRSAFSRLLMELHQSQKQLAKAGGWRMLNSGSKIASDVLEGKFF